MMNFRQRMGWIGVGLYLLASAAAFYYVFEINETYNKLALEHIQQHPKEPQEGTTWTHSLKECVCRIIVTLTLFFPSCHGGAGPVKSIT
ncbi:lysosomal enzyme trafficking factor isoform 2-T3 [Acridotheres tristis]